MYSFTTSKGNVVEITYVKDTRQGQPCYAVMIDGEQVAKATTVTDYSYRPMEIAGKTIVGVLEFRIGTGRKAKQSGVALDADQVAAVLAEAEASRTDEDREKLVAAQTRNAANALREQRRDLASRVQHALEDMTPDNLYESEYEHVNRKRQEAAKAAEPRYEAAKQALREFDAAHPEVLAAIKKEKEEALERNRWN